MLFTSSLKFHSYFILVLCIPVACRLLHYGSTHLESCIVLSCSAGHGHGLDCHPCCFSYCLCDELVLAYLLTCHFLLFICIHVICVRYETACVLLSVFVETALFASVFFFETTYSWHHVVWLALYQDSTDMCLNVFISMCEWNAIYSECMCLNIHVVHPSRLCTWCWLVIILIQEWVC